MWLLTQVNSASPHEGILLLPNVEFVVGRKDCAVLIQNDPSISRKHAVITISHNEDNLKNPDAPSQVSLQDTSKYGTSVNGSKITGTVKLKSGDEVLFGSRDSCYRLTYSPLVVITSCLDNNKKKALRSTLLRLGGHILDEWKPGCVTHLVMDGLTFTIKVVHALAECCNIVTPAFFEALLKGVNSTTPLPTAKRFLPPTKEESLKSEDVSFEPVQARKSLLKGKSVLFLSKKQYKRLHIAVELSGGTSGLRQPQDMLDEQDLVSDGTLVIMMDTKELSTLPVKVQHWVAQVVDTLKMHKCRPIPESELGLALLHLSLEKYCNPSIDAVPPLTQSLVVQSLQAAELLSQQMLPQAPAQFKKPAAPAAKSKSDKESSDRSMKRLAADNGSFLDIAPETQSQGFSERNRTKRRKTDENEEEVLVPDTPDPPKNWNIKRASTCLIQESQVDSKNFAWDTQQNESTDEPVQSTNVRPGLVPDSMESGSECVTPPSKRPKTSSVVKSSDAQQQNSHQTKQDQETSWLSVSSVTNGRDDAAQNSEDKRLGASKVKNRAKGDVHVGDENSRDISGSKNQLTRTTQHKGEQNNNEVSRVHEATGADLSTELTRTTRQETVIDVPQGFLCARVPQKISDVKSETLHYAEEDSLPRNLIVVDHVALVVRRAPVTAPTNDVPSVVKNFKKFRKQWYPGSGDALPRIIGGSDLTVHQSIKAHDTEEWFLEAKQVEAKQTRQERIAEDLFRWEGSNTTRGRRARR